MTKDFNGELIDIHKIVARPLYFGLLSNVLLPMGLLLLCYYLDQNNMLANNLGDFANIVYYVFLVLAATQGAFAYWWRGKLLSKPMVRRKETFQQDILYGILHALQPVFITIAAISLYGYIYFFLTARFKEAVFMVFFSFIIFQFVRPRIGSVNKIIEQQYHMAEQGKFRSGGELISG